MKIDAHFHIFSASAINQSQSRYPIQYDATIDRWHSLANLQGIAGGIIVQPSFLGVDNSLLLAALNQSPNKLKGVVVLAPNTSRSALEELKEQGAIGVRLNLYGISDPHSIIRNYWRLIEFLNESKMHLELHHDDGLLNALLSDIPTGTEIVVDHFGRPKTTEEFFHESIGILKHSSSLWVKLSAQYRTPHLDHTKVLDYWLERLGPSKLLWGSDWPHTGFEETQEYAKQLNDLNTFIHDEQLLSHILISNPKNLYWQEPSIAK